MARYFAPVNYARFVSRAADEDISRSIMPTVATEGRFKFVVNTRENRFEPPHVHVWVGNEDVCRIELNSGTFMDEPPPGDYRNIMDAYARHALTIRREWDRIHQR